MPILEEQEDAIVSKNEPKKKGGANTKSKAKGGKNKNEEEKETVDIFNIYLHGSH